MAWIAAFFYAVMLCAFTRDLRQLTRPLAVAAIMLALTAPWWGTVIARHGSDVFLAAMSSGALGPSALAGLAALILSRRWFLPALVLGVVFFEDRNFHYPLDLAAPLLLGVLVVEVARRLKRAPGGGDGSAARLRAALLMVAGGGALVFVLAAWLAWNLQVVATSLPPRPDGEAESFRWLAGNTPAGSAVLVVTGAPAWAWDYTAEWLPALAQRRSPATVQGSEWLQGERGFQASTQRARALHACLPEGLACIEAWRNDSGLSFSHIYVDKSDPSRPLRQSLAASGDYALVFDGPGAEVYVHRSP
jgi:hypothetical protein